MTTITASFRALIIILATALGFFLVQVHAAPIGAVAMTLQAREPGNLLPGLKYKIKELRKNKFFDDCGEDISINDTFCEDDDGPGYMVCTIFGLWRKDACPLIPGDPGCVSLWQLLSLSAELTSDL